MSTLLEYLGQKREALLGLRRRIDAGEIGPAKLTARVTAEGRSGVRRIRIRDFQILSDSPPDFAGYDLGPASPEIALGALGSCVTHIYLIQAAALEVPLESLEVVVEGFTDPRAGRPGHETIPVHPQDISYVVKITSSASAERIEELRRNVEAACPLLSLIRNPQTVNSRVELSAPQ